jgi:hypothetical protein
LGRAQTERRTVSPGETARTAAPLNEEAKRKTAAVAGRTKMSGGALRDENRRLKP